MKHLYIIGGTMGIGKTTVCQKLKTMLPGAVFLDGDWCWDMHPFQVTEETKKMVVENICFLLNQYLRSNAYENVIFCWVMHQQPIIDDILGRLDTTGVAVRTISLVCDEKTLEARLRRDVEAGIRQPDVIARSLARLPLYGSLNTELVDTTGKSVEETAREIACGRVLQTRRTVRENIHAPYSLHDMNIVSVEVAGAHVTLRTQSGLVQAAPPYGQPEGWVEFSGVRWDFSYVYLLAHTGNVGTFLGEKRFLRDFFEENPEPCISIMDETYGYNCTRYTGYVTIRGVFCECILELYHEGDMTFVEVEV